MAYLENPYLSSYDPPDEINSHYIILKELGKGAYGTVYLAKERKTGEQCAIKRIEDVFRTRTDAKRTLREITILRQCHHANIVKLKHILLPRDEEVYKQLWIVQEYGGWDLSKVLKSWKRITGWCDKHVKSIVYQTLCGLFYLQSANLVHRDLKPSNILIDTKCNVKIIDFGLARQMRSSSSAPPLCRKESTDAAGFWDAQGNGVERQLTQHVVTRWYRAPELILMQDHYTGAIDIWSVGCILAELLQTLEPEVTRVRPLFPGTTCFPLSAPKKDKTKYIKIEQEFRAETHQLEKIFEITGTPSLADIEEMDEGPMKEFLLNLEPIGAQPYEQLLPSAPVEAIVLLRAMLTFNPRKRISVEEALKSPYFDDVRNAECEVAAQEEMTFPFEHETNLSDSMEKKKIRQLIYNEALLFNKNRRPSSRKSPSISPVASSSNLTGSAPYIVPKVVVSPEKTEKKKECTIV